MTFCLLRDPTQSLTHSFYFNYYYFFCFCEWIKTLNWLVKLFAHKSKFKLNLNWYVYPAYFRIVEKCYTSPECDVYLFTVLSSVHPFQEIFYFFLFSNNNGICKIYLLLNQSVFPFYFYSSNLFWWPKNCLYIFNFLFMGKENDI